MGVRQESPSEALTRAFYAWEVNGRGYRQYEEPVTLEPAFEFPWMRMEPARTGTTLDDGQSHSALTFLFERISSWLEGKKNKAESWRRKQGTRRSSGRLGNA